MYRLHIRADEIAGDFPGKALFELQARAGMRQLVRPDLAIAEREADFLIADDVLLRDVGRTDARFGDARRASGRISRGGRAAGGETGGCECAEKCCRFHGFLLRLVCPGRLGGSAACYRAGMASLHRIFLEPLTALFRAKCEGRLRGQKFMICSLRGLGGRRSVYEPLALRRQSCPQQTGCFSPFFRP